MTRIIEPFDIADARETRSVAKLDRIRERSTCRDCMWCIPNDGAEASDVAPIHNMVSLLCVPAPTVSRRITDIANEVMEDALWLLRDVAWCRSLDFMTKASCEVGECPEFWPIDWEVGE